MRKDFVILAAVTAMAGVSCSRVTVEPAPPPPPAVPMALGPCKHVPVPNDQCIDQINDKEDCGALVTYDAEGKVANVKKVQGQNAPECDIKALNDLTDLKVISPASKKARPLLGLTGSMKFGDGTTVCYPTSPPWCVCTKKPCP